MILPVIIARSHPRTQQISLLISLIRVIPKLSKLPSMMAIISLSTIKIVKSNKKHKSREVKGKKQAYSNISEENKTCQL